MENEVPEHRCQQCRKVFTKKKNLNQHVRAVHDGVKKHQCETCSKKFSRKQYKELHERHCLLSTRSEADRPKKVYKKKKGDLNLTPKLLTSVFGGICQNWTVVYKEDVSNSIDPTSLLQDGTKAMKQVIRKHLHRSEEYALKFYFAVHAVFIKATTDVKTDPPIVLQTNPYTAYRGTDLDPLLNNAAENLSEKISTFERNGSGWVIDHLIRLDINVTSFDVLC